MFFAEYSLPCRNCTFAVGHFGVSALLYRVRAVSLFHLVPLFKCFGACGKSCLENFAALKWNYIAEIQLWACLVVCWFDIRIDGLCEGLLWVVCDVSYAKRCCRSGTGRLKVVLSLKSLKWTSDRQFNVTAFPNARFCALLVILCGRRLLWHLWRGIYADTYF